MSQCRISLLVNEVLIGTEKDTSRWKEAKCEEFPVALAKYSWYHFLARNQPWIKFILYVVSRHVAAML